MTLSAMSSAEVQYHFHSAAQLLIAERDGIAVGVLPWTQEGNIIHLYQQISPTEFFFACVAPHERRKGIGSEMATRMRQHFSRDDGWEVRTSKILTPEIADYFYREGKDDRREGWFDFTGVAGGEDIGTQGVMAALSMAQTHLDELLST